MLLTSRITLDYTRTLNTLVNEAVEGPKSTSDAQTEGKKEEEEMREGKEQEQEQ